MWTVFGQDHLLKRIESTLQQRKQSHANMLCGPPHVGKMALALNLTQALNCSEGPGVPCGACSQCSRIANGHHAVVRIITPGYSEEGRSNRTTIGINDIKEGLRHINLNPYEGSTSVVILDGAESMSDEAANALLKTLEEPPPHVMFLLLATNDESVLPTIRSRCQNMSLHPLSKDLMIELLVTQYQAPPMQAEQLFRLSRGCMGWAVRALEDPQILEQRQADLEKLQETLKAGLETRFTYANEVATLFGKDRKAAKDLLALWLRWWRDLLLIKEGADEFLHNADHEESLKIQASSLNTVEILKFINRLIQTMSSLDSNANPRLAMEVLMLNLPIEANQV